LSMPRTMCRFAALALRVAVYAAVVAKLLVPVGYMPGPLAAGLPVQVCDAGFAPVAVPAHAGHSGHTQHGGPHHEHDQASELHWKYCPSGALATAGAIPVEYRITLLPVESERLALLDASGVTRTPFVAFRSRAPPLGLALV